MRIRRWIRRHRAFLIGFGSIMDISGKATHRAMRHNLHVDASSLRLDGDSDALMAASRRWMERGK